MKATTILTRSFYLKVWVSVFAAVLIWSYIGAKDEFTWWLEALPAILGSLILWITRKTYPLTPLLYVFILLHCIVLMVGAHYTYAEVPLFDWIRDMLGQERNNFDKVGHFLQGFVPALIAREILLRNHVISGRNWLHFLVVSFALAFSALYELIEWLVAELSDTGAEAFLGTQGYVWDTQTDMAWALLGALIAMIFFSSIQDQQLKKFDWT